MLKLLAEIAGCALVVAGVSLVSIPAALVAAGVLVVYVAEVHS